MILRRAWRSFFQAWMAAASIAALSLGGCAGGLPDVHSITALSIGDSDADKPKTGQPPILAELIQPGTLDDIAIGKANAPVTIVQYVSLTCPTCGKFQSAALPKLKKAFVDKGKARIVFREFPEDAASMTAALALRCVSEKEFIGAMEKLLTHQKEWAGAEANKDALYKLVKGGGGLKREKFDACLTDAAMTAGITSGKERAAGWGVTVTPTFFVNEKKVQGAVSIEEMQGFVDAAYAATQAPAAAQPQAKPKAS
jgi:protein-disulfide isomerase